MPSRRTPCTRSPPAGCELLFGPYRAPRFGYGDAVHCEARGDAVICATTDAPIPWPVGRRGRFRAIVVYGQLVDAVRRESAQAVAWWWGVSSQTVSAWRKALGVGAVTEGTRRLKRDHALGPAGDAARERAFEVIRDPERDAPRREKIAEAKRGKPRPRHVIEAMRKGRNGKPHSEEARRKISEANRRRRAGG